MRRRAGLGSKPSLEDDFGGLFFFVRWNLLFSGRAVYLFLGFWSFLAILIFVLIKISKTKIEN